VQHILPHRPAPHSRATSAISVRPRAGQAAGGGGRRRRVGARPVGQDALRGGGAGGSAARGALPEGPHGRAAQPGRRPPATRLSRRRRRPCPQAHLLAHHLLSAAQQQLKFVRLQLDTSRSIWHGLANLQIATSGWARCLRLLQTYCVGVLFLHCCIQWTLVLMRETAGSHMPGVQLYCCTTLSPCSVLWMD
jgi:hypothetical protein